MRKLVKTLLSLSLMAPAAALALGLGDVKLHSALNQRLEADIELLSVESAEVDEIEVSLASADTFAKLGLDRPAVLMNIQFAVQKDADGKYFIKATSTEAIREPFLDFLIEVNWPSGRVLREYTLLLDPPVSHGESAPMLDSAQTAAAQATPEARPAQATPATRAPAGAPASTTYYPKPAEQTSMPRDGIVYGPVKANDTLWRIAQKIRPSKDVSLQQVMMALLKANPYAFFDNNINRLKKGYVLRIDDPALLTAMSKMEAAREVARQTRQWQDYRQALAAKATERQQAQAGAAPAGTAAARSEPKLKLVAPDKQSGQAGAAADGEAAEGDMNEQLMLALESSAAQRKENEVLQGRVKELEEQLQDMQRLLALKDADLASLQQQLRSDGQAVELPSQKQPAEEAAGQARQAEEGAETAQPPVAEAGAASADAQTAETATSTKGGEAAAPVAQEKQPKPAAKPKPKPKAKPKVMPKPAPQPTLLESMMQDPYVLYGGGTAIILILVLLLYWLRRRSKGGFQESILSGGTSSMLNTKGDEGTGETSFLSDLAISGMGGGTITTDEGEVDPLTEADVFMAYGRNQQAEEVLKKALESNPGRPDVIAKLLEVYYADKEKEQFDTLVNEHADALKENEELWGKVAAMGHELSPENELFAGADASAAPAIETTPAAKNEPLTDDVLDIGLDLDELTAEMESEASEESFDLGLDLDDGEKKEETAGAESQEMDFDLDLGDEAQGSEPEAGEESSELDLDISDLTAQPEAAPAEPEGSEDDLGALDFDLGDFGTETEEAAPAEADSSVTEQASDSDMGLGDLDFGSLDLETAADDAAASASDETPSIDMADLESAAGDLDDFGDLGELDDESLLGDSDENATKLDLAQAYIEMGDNEGARSMLEEVVESGNDEQKQQAQALLGKI